MLCLGFFQIDKITTKLILLQCLVIFFIFGSLGERAGTQKHFGDSCVVDSPLCGPRRAVTALKATKNFKISDDMPGLDIFNFLLPRDQIDDISI